MRPGRLPEPVALAVATHLALCPAAAPAIAATKPSAASCSTGSGAGVAWPTDAWERLLRPARRRSGRRRGAGADGPRASTRAHLLPRPLRDYLPAPLEQLRWRSYGVAAEVELPTSGARLPDDAAPRPRRADGAAAHPRGHGADRGAGRCVPRRDRALRPRRARDRRQLRSITGRWPTRPRTACA